MNSTGYKLLGYGVWHGGRWYLRRRYLSKLPSRRRAGIVMLAAFAALGVLIAIARRG
jgi:hypothetical protein